MSLLGKTLATSIFIKFVILTKFLALFIRLFRKSSCNLISYFPSLYIINHFLGIFPFSKYLSIYLFHFISSIGKFVVFHGILLYLANIYEESTIGYITMNSSSKSLPLEFKPIDIDLPQEVISTSNYFLHSQNFSNPSEKNVFLDDYDFRLHVFSGYRKY